jgi:quinol monooxygenase YgiN
MAMGLFNIFKMKSIAAALAMLFCMSSFAQENKNSINMVEKIPMEADGIVRLSKIEVDPEYLDEYVKFAAEVGSVSLQTEPGVLAMYSVQEKDNPCKITILEIYASQEAYKSHIASAHFQKYKHGTINMVKKLELVDQTPLNPASKIVNFIQQP